MYPSPLSSGQPTDSPRLSSIQEGKKRVRLSDYPSREMDTLQQATDSIKRYTKLDKRSILLPQPPHQHPMQRPTRTPLMELSNLSWSVSKRQRRCRHCQSSSTVSRRTRSLPCSKMEWESMTNCAKKFGQNLPPDLSFSSEPPHTESHHQRSKVKSRTCHEMEKGILNGDWSLIQDRRSTWNDGFGGDEFLIHRSLRRRNLLQSHYHQYLRIRRQTCPMFTIHSLRSYHSLNSIRLYSPCRIFIIPSSSNSPLTPTSTR